MNTNIGLATPTYDLDGAIIIQNDLDEVRYSGARRILRIATLDGGVYVSDFGYTAADRTIAIKISNAIEVVFEQLRYLMENYSSLVVCTPHGAYTGALQDVTHSGGDVEATLLLTGDA